MKNAAALLPVRFYSNGVPHSFQPTLTGELVYKDRCPTFRSEQNIGTTLPEDLEPLRELSPEHLLELSKPPKR